MSHFTPHPSTIHSLRFTLPHFTLHAPHFPLHTSLLTLSNCHFTLHTPHFTLSTSPFTFHTPHFTHHNSHCTPDTKPTRFTHHSLHSTLRTPPFTHHSLHSTLYTPHFIFGTSHSSAQHSALHTPGNISPVLASPIDIARRRHYRVAKQLVLECNKVPRLPRDMRIHTPQNITLSHFLLRHRAATTLESLECQAKFSVTFTTHHPSAYFSQRKRQRRQ